MPSSTRPPSWFAATSTSSADCTPRFGSAIDLRLSGDCCCIDDEHVATIAGALE
jgi:hypothetical protein